MDNLDSCTENDTLLSKKDRSQECTVDFKPNWRHALIMPACFFAAFGGQLCLFVSYEWTHDQVAKEYFGNTTNNISTCRPANKSDTEYAKYQTVQGQSAKWLTIYSVSELIPVILVQLVLPSYTDTYGRKFLLILTMFGACVKSVAITLTVHFEASFWYLVAGLTVCGMTGTFFALLSAAFSFIADITFSQQYRTAAIVVLEAMLLISSVAASFLSGYFIETIKLGFYYTSLIGTGLGVLGLVLIFFTPESLPKQRRSSHKPICATIKRMVDFYISSEFKGQRKAYILLLLAFSFGIVAGINRQSMETLYFLGQPFCWGPSKIGVFSMVRTGAQTLLGLGSVRFLQICLSDVAIAILSTVSTAISYMIEAFATTTLMIYMVPVAGMFSFLVTPMTRSLMSSMTSPDKQGAMFAGVATIEVISTLVASLSQNTIYSFTVSFMNGFVFIILAILAVINMVFLCIYQCTKPQGKSFVIFIEENEK